MTIQKFQLLYTATILFTCLPTATTQQRALEPILNNDRLLHDCDIKQSDSSVCLRCADGYVLSPNRTRCIQISSLPSTSLSNCIQISVFGECIVCECGYSFMSSAGICVPSPPDLDGCQTFHGQQCLHPKEDYEIIISERSQQFSSSQHYQFLQFSQGTNCEIRHLTNGDCIRCHHGYVLTSQNICTKAPFVVANSHHSYFEDGELISRDLRFFVLGNGVYPIIENCIVHQLSSSSSSSDDHDGAFVICEECIAGKIRNESKNRCSKQPVEICSLVSDADPSICIECSDNASYYLLTIPHQGQKCVPRYRNKYDGCQEYLPNADGCLKCRNHYILSNNYCIDGSQIITRSWVGPKIILNCAIYSDSSTCIECMASFTMTTTGKCEEERDKKCLLQDENGVCKKCVLGMQYDKLKQSCDISPQNCALEDPNHPKHCQRCRSGNYLNAQGQCEVLVGCLISNGVDVVCLLCSSGWYLYDNQKGTVICKLITNYDHCYLSDGKNDQCLVCARYFILLYNGQCQPQVMHNREICDVYGFYFQDDNDKYCVEYSEQMKAGCLVFDPRANKCLVCNQPWYLEKRTGNCQNIPLCMVSSTLHENVCLETFSSNLYLTAEGKISPKYSTCETNMRDPICVKRDSNNNIGLSLYIKDGESLVDFSESEIKNVEVARNCFVIEYSSSNEGHRCFQCLNLFFPNTEGACVPISVKYCMISDGKSDKCLVCYQEYIQDAVSGQCVGLVKTIPHCIQLIEKNGYVRCQQCESLYYLMSGGLKCDSIRNPNCIESNGLVDKCSCNAWKKNEFNEICDFDFCAEIDFNLGVCLKCMPRFIEIQNPFFDSPMCVQDNNYFCKRTHENLVCIECNAGYYLIHNQYLQYYCEKIPMHHCLEMDPEEKVCTKCEEGYFLSPKNKCLIIPHCIVFTTVCTKCSTPYVVNELGACVLIPNCLKLTDTRCLLCESSFYLDASHTACLPISNCQSSAGISCLCEACQPSFELIEFICIPRNPIDYCVEYSDSQECLKCQVLYYLSQDSSSCQRIANVENCKFSDGITNECLQCETNGHVLEKGKKCLLMPNCMISDGLSTCLFCSRMHILSTATQSNNYMSVCDNKRQVIEYCAYYDPIEPECERCESLYYLSEDRLQCIQIEKSRKCFLSDGSQNQECQICDTSSLRQFQYKSGYYYIRKRAEGFENYKNMCEFNGNVSVRSICSPNHYQDSDLCHQRQYNTDNCLLFHTQSNGCSICNSGFILQDDSSGLLPYGSYCAAIPTVDSVANCELYKPNSNICIKCKQNMDLDIIEYYLITISNTCMNLLSYKCKLGSEFIVNERKCSKPHIPSCELVSQECSAGYALCCLMCKKGYYLLNNSCEKQPIIEGCAVYSRNAKGICVICDPNYTLSNETSCEKIQFDSHCKIPQNTQPFCSECDEGYSFTNSGAVVCAPTDIPNCGHIGVNDVGEQFCLSCKQNYLFDKYKNCVRSALLDANCMTFDSQQICTQCKNRYFMNKFKQCIKVNSVCGQIDCVEYSVESLADQYKCKVCTHGYTLDGNQSCTKESTIKETPNEHSKYEEAENDGNKKESPMQLQSEQNNSDLLMLFALFLVPSAILGAILFLKRKRNNPNNNNNQDSVQQDSVFMLQLQTTSRSIDEFEDQQEDEL